MFFSGVSRIGEGGLSGDWALEQIFVATHFARHFIQILELKTEILASFHNHHIRTALLLHVIMFIVGQINLDPSI